MKQHFGVLMNTPMIHTYLKGLCPLHDEGKYDMKIGKDMVSHMG
jgi:hypothetical protein